MPVVLKVRGGKYCVVERDTGRVKKCYANKEEAKDYLAVLNMTHAGIPLTKAKSKKKR